MSLPASSGRILTQRRRRQWSKATTIVLFLLPSLALFVLFIVIPIVQAAHYSLYHWNGLGSLDNYTGLKNYQTLFRDPVFLTALKNNALIAVLSLALQLPSALALALLINRKMPGRTFFRTVFFLPYILSEVVTGLIWSFIYNPSNGLVAGLLRQINPMRLLRHTSPIHTPSCWRFSWRCAGSISDSISCSMSRGCKISPTM